MGEGRVEHETDRWTGTAVAVGVTVGKAEEVLVL